MVKLKELLNENKSDLKEVKKIVDHLEGLAKHYGEGFKRYEKYFKSVTKKLNNMTVRDAESLLKKHKSLVVSQYNRQTEATIEELIKELKKD
tara:strand:- start:62 stop:337 length:276 start_codon:yes stop_codon:yes gene_type:complete